MNTQKINTTAIQLRRRFQRGFSLIEMLIVMALMALIGTFVATNVIKKFSQAKYDAAKIQIRQLATALDDFKRVCNFYPTSEMGLQALIEKPVGRDCKNYDPDGFLKDKKVPNDPWDTPFGYESDGSKFVLKSLGDDQQPGGEGTAKDLASDALD